MNIRYLIKQHEGFRSNLYRCPAGRQTIGYGHNLDARGISERAAEVILDDDLADTRRECELYISRFDELDEVRQAVLLDMAYNMGIHGLMEFRNFLTAVYFKRWKRAGEEMMDSRWATQVGKRAERLRQMMETGEWPEEI